MCVCLSLLVITSLGFLCTLTIIPVLQAEAEGSCAVGVLKKRTLLESHGNPVFSWLYTRGLMMMMMMVISFLFLLNIRTIKKCMTNIGKGHDAIAG